MMSKIQILIFSMLLKMIAAQDLNAQPYINKLYDFNTTNDWGHSIFPQSDGSYFILGLNFKNNQSGISANIISADGNSVSQKKEIYRQYAASIYSGTAGRQKNINNYKYLIPLTVVSPQPNLDYGNYYRSGIAVLDSHGDTVFTKLYTDSSKYKEIIYDCYLMPDSGYLVAGGRNAVHTNKTNYKGLLYRTNSKGEILWEKEYTNANDCEINSVQLTKDGDILIGIHCLELATLGQDAFYKYRPLFILADSSNGAIKKYDIYTSGYAGGALNGGGNIFEDKNGGYFHWGQIDYIYSTPLEHPYNFPPYFARIDTDFQFTSTKVFQPVLGGSHRWIFSVEQTSDSGYIMMGSAQIIDSAGGYFGWAARMNKNGFVLWDNYYIIDAAFDGYLVDAAELPDGGFVFTGSHTDNSIQPRTQDMWIVRVDSNGCIVPGCAPTTVKEISLKEEVPIDIYPNPTTGNFNISSIASGKLYIFSYDGRHVANFKIVQGITSLNLPDKLNSGVYIARFVTTDNKTYNVRLIYQP